MGGEGEGEGEKTARGPPFMDPRYAPGFFVADVNITSTLIDHLSFAIRIKLN